MTIISLFQLVTQGFASLLCIPVVGQLGANVACFVVGGLATVGGIFLLFVHQADVNRVLTEELSDSQKRIETRKYYRRSMTSTMITLIGCLIVGWAWVTNKYVAATFLTTILILVLVVSMLGMIDLMSIGFQQLKTKERMADRATLDRLIQEHKARKQQESSEDRVQNNDGL